MFTMAPSPPANCRTLNGSSTRTNWLWKSAATQKFTAARSASWAFRSFICHLPHIPLNDCRARVASWFQTSADRQLKARCLASRCSGRSIAAPMQPWERNISPNVGGPRKASSVLNLAKHRSWTSIFIAYWIAVLDIRRWIRVARTSGSAGRADSPTISAELLISITLAHSSSASPSMMFSLKL